MTQDTNNDWTEETNAASTATAQCGEKGCFCGFVLLEDGDYDLAALRGRLGARWGVAANAAGDFLTDATDAADDLFLETAGAMVTVSLLRAPVPAEELTLAAERSADWPQAREVAARHRAQLMVSVLPLAMTARTASAYYAQLLEECLAAGGACAVYTSGALLPPERARRLSPEDLVRVVIYETEAGRAACTWGLDAFGLLELEVLSSRRDADALRAFLRGLSRRLIAGETVLSASAVTDDTGARYPARRGDGVRVDGHSVQIDY